MKIKSLSAIILLAVIFLSTSCKKDVIESITGSMSAKVGGEDWSTLIQTGVKIGEKMTILATSSGDPKKTIYLYINGITVGKYSLATLEGQSDAASYLKVTTGEGENETSTKYISTTGEVEITSVDIDKNRISGTFYFTASSTGFDPIEITEGKFTNVKYTGSN